MTEQTKSMNTFFDCYFAFAKVAMARGIHDRDDRVRLFEIYISRME